MKSVTLKMALRSLLRNPRRTALSIAGIVLGCTLGAAIIGLEYGGKEVYVRAAVETGIGHLQISPERWLERREPTLRLTDGEAALAAARAAPHVVAAAPRVRASVLLAMGSQVQGVELVGVEPVSEQKANKMVRRVASGRYLREGDRGVVVLGAELARRLKVQVNDDLVVTGVTESGEMQSAMLTVVGTITSGSKELDAGIAHSALEDAMAISGSRGLGEISILLDDFEAMDSVKTVLAPKLPPRDVLLGWEQVEPELYSHIEQDRATSQVFIGMALLLVFLGLASAELTSVLERRKEFAVLAAVGMKPRQLARQSLVEGLVLGIAGTIATLVVAVPLIWYLHRVGIDLSGVISAETTFEGVSIEPRLYSGFGLWIVRDVALLAIISTVLASLYPAWFASRTDPSTALRVAQ